VAHIGHALPVDLGLNLESSQPAIKSVSSQSRRSGKRDGYGGRKLNASVEPRTRLDAKGIRMEQKEVQSDVKQHGGYD
jgi:hypothetical protein